MEISAFLEKKGEEKQAVGLKKFNEKNEKEWSVIVKKSEFEATLGDSSKALPWSVCSYILHFFIFFFLFFPFLKVIYPL